MTNKLILCSCFVLFNFLASAQKMDDLSPEEKKEFEYRAGRAVKLFTTSLETIPRFEGEPILKDKAILNTLELFIKNAEIELLLANGDTITKKLPNYLNNLRNYKSKGTLVEIEIVDFVIDNIKPHDTELGKYTVDFKFVQIFRKKKNYTPSLLNDENFKEIEWDYIDRTEKSGTAYVNKITDRHGTRWKMLLGNIEAENVEVIK